MVPGSSSQETRAMFAQQRKLHMSKVVRRAGLTTSTNVECLRFNNKTFSRRRTTRTVIQDLNGVWTSHVLSWTRLTLNNEVDTFILVTEGAPRSVCAEIAPYSHADPSTSSQMMKGGSCIS